MKGFLQGFIHAFKGIYEVIRSERNFRVHLLALCVVVAVGFYFDISVNDWISIALISALVLGLEALNSAIEKLCNELTLERKESIRIIKDIAAGAVLIAAIAAVVIAGLIFYKYIK